MAGVGGKRAGGGRGHTLPSSALRRTRSATTSGWMAYIAEGAIADVSMSFFFVLKRTAAGFPVLLCPDPRQNGEEEKKKRKKKSRAVSLQARTCGAKEVFGEEVFGGLSGNWRVEVDWVLALTDPSKVPQALAGEAEWSFAGGAVQRQVCGFQAGLVESGQRGWLLVSGFWFLFGREWKEKGGL